MRQKESARQRRESRELNDDSIWFTYGTHLAHLEAGSNKVEVDPGIQIPKERVVALLWDGAQKLWLRTATKLARLNPATHKFTLEKDVHRTRQTMWKESRRWIKRNGCWCHPRRDCIGRVAGGRWQVITDKQGISSNDIQFAMEDREGTLWIGGSGTGLDRLPGMHEWTGWTTAEGLPDNSTWATQRDHSGTALGEHGARHCGVGWADAPVGEGSCAGREQADTSAADAGGRRWIDLGTDSDGLAGAN